MLLKEKEYNELYERLIDTTNRVTKLPKMLQQKVAEFHQRVKGKDNENNDNNDSTETDSSEGEEMVDKPGNSAQIKKKKNKKVKVAYEDILLDQNKENEDDLDSLFKIPKKKKLKAGKGLNADTDSSIGGSLTDLLDSFDSDDHFEEGIGEMYNAERILKERFGKNGRKQYLVKWKGYATKHSTWEPRINIIDNRLITNFEEAKKKRESKKRKNN